MNDDAAAGGDGSSWASAFRYLQDGLAGAHAGDDIWVAEGTYKPDQGKGKTPGDRTASFVLEGAVDLYGGFLGSETSRQPLGDHNKTILSGEIANDSAGWSYHVVTTSGPSVISGFRITKGNANGVGDYKNGGGMYNKNSSPTLTNCVFSGNSATFGGGMYNISSSPTLTNCVFSGNSGNSNNSYGGGMYNYSSSPILTNCIFAGNSASYGGGMYNQSSSSPTLINCVFSDNSGTNGGGGMYNQSSSSPTLANCVFSGNSANSGGGMYNDDSSSPTLTNCMILGGYAGTGNLAANASFVRKDDPIGPDGKWFTADDGLRLNAGSPGVDSGSDAAISMIADLSGFARIQGAAVDMGAYEYGNSLPAAKHYFVDDSAPVGGDGSSWANAFKYLQDALTIGGTGVELRVAQGGYHPDKGSGRSAGDRWATFRIPAGAIVVGGYGGLGAVSPDERNATLYPTILSGDIGLDKFEASIHVVTLEGGTLKGCVVEKGYANTHPEQFGNVGAGIFGGGILVDCVVRLNEAVSGGGMFCNRDTTIRRTAFYDNKAKEGGGGISCHKSGIRSLVSENSTFRRNLAELGNGGAVKAQDDSGFALEAVLFEKCVFEDNNATGSGGAFYARTDWSEYYYFAGCSFIRNNAGTGGAVSGGITIVNDSTFTSNSAANGKGGAIHTGAIKAYSTLFQDNYSQREGGGVYCGGNGMASSGDVRWNLYFNILKECHFLANRGLGSGGAFYTVAVTLVDLCLFEDSLSGNSGGGVFASNELKISRSRFFNNKSKNGGGLYLDSSTLFLIHNSSFLENEATAGNGGAVYLKKWGQNEHVSLASCMFASNKASGAGGALKIGGGSFSPVINCTFYKNEAGNGGAIHEDGTALELYNSILSENGANAVPDKEYSSRNVIETSTAAELFVNPGSPKGADGKLGTADDGLRLRRGTLAIDRGTSFEIPTDLFDFDQDGNLTELSPIDLAGNPRIVGASPDLGPYESDWNGTSATPSTVQVDVASGGNGAVSGGGTFASGSIVSLYANAAPGYVFEGWIGDLQSTSNPYSFAAGSNLNLAGNFSKDTGDDDGDGLSNYAELATYGTKVNDNDTDDDGLLDNEEVQIGTNPKSSDATLVNFFNAKTATDQTTARTNALAEGRTSGINAVKANPTTYGLAPIAEMTATGATPHTNGWYYQPEWGWLWTNAKTFPYVYRASTGGKQSGWLYFREGSAPPYFHNYATGTWSKLGE